MKAVREYKTFHCELLTRHTATVFKEIHVMICHGLRCFEMLLEASNRQQNALLHRMWKDVNLEGVRGGGGGGGERHMKDNLIYCDVAI